MKNMQIVGNAKTTRHIETNERDDNVAMAATTENGLPNIKKKLFASI